MKRMYTVTEAAEIMRLHPKTVRKKVREGAINAVRVGGQYRISRQEIDSILGREAGEAPPNASGMHATVASIIDMENVSPEQGMRMTNTIMAALNSTETRTHANCVYYEDLARLKVMVNCDMESAPDILLMLKGLLNMNK